VPLLGLDVTNLGCLGIQDIHSFKSLLSDALTAPYFDVSRLRRVGESENNKNFLKQ
jgi:hypothetical protein